MVSERNGKNIEVRISKNKKYKQEMVDTEYKQATAQATARGSFGCSVNGKWRRQKTK